MGISSPLGNADMTWNKQQNVRRYWKASPHVWYMEWGNLQINICFFRHRNCCLYYHRRSCCLCCHIHRHGFAMVSTATVVVIAWRGPSVLGRATDTIMFFRQLLRRSVLRIALFPVSSSAISTNPYPLERPVSLSMMTLAETTSPYSANNSSNSASLKL